MTALESSLGSWRNSSRMAWDLFDFAPPESLGALGMLSPECWASSRGTDSKVLEIPTKIPIVEVTILECAAPKVGSACLNCADDLTTERSQQPAASQELSRRRFPAAHSAAGGRSRAAAARSSVRRSLSGGCVLRS